MRWRGGRESENVEDRRSMGPPVMVGGGLGLLLLVVVVALLGGNPLALLQQLPQAPPGGGQVGVPQPGEQGEVDDEARQFVAVVLGDTEDVWTEQFRRMGKVYREPKLVLFSGSTRSGCGFASAQVGPFYCPRDETVYIDLRFFDEMKTKFRAPGEFAQAYVIAHEIGHHVQNLLGIMEQVHAEQQRVSKEEANELSVRLELQADFLAGVWAHHADRARQIIEQGDIEEALRAANAIGDDRLQMQAQGYVVPDSFTHGSSEQRVRWFRRGLQTGDLDAGDTFRVRDL
ncbi:MAG: KPN_02809 family neutral zinc metallopeptidase [Planctomycetaceae bacterium]